MSAWIEKLPDEDSRFQRVEAVFRDQQIAGSDLRIEDLDLDIASEWLKDPEQYGVPLQQRTDPIALILRYGYRDPNYPSPDDFLTRLVDAVVDQLPGIVRKSQALMQ